MDIPAAPEHYQDVYQQVLNTRGDLWYAIYLIPVCAFLSLMPLFHSLSYPSSTLNTLSCHFSSPHFHIFLMPLLQSIIQHCSFTCECVCVSGSHLSSYLSTYHPDLSTLYLFLEILIFSLIHRDPYMSCDISNSLLPSACPVFLINKFFLQSEL